MKIESNVNRLLNSISYRFASTLIDVGDKCKLFNYASEVLLTHAHFDHIYGLNELLKLRPDVRVYTNKEGAYMLLDARKNMSFYNETPFVFEYSDNIVIVNDGDVLEMESGKLVTAVFTPGHNPSCITWVMGDAIFTGDSYIPGAKTVTNLPDGNRQLAEASILMIKQLSMGRTIYPGHKV